MSKTADLIRLVLLALALASCGTDSGPGQAPASPTTMATPTGLPAAATLTQPGAPSWDDLVGWWGMIDGGFYFEFRADGSCARQIESDEYTFFTTEARCQLVGTDRLIIQLHGEEPTEYEWRLEDPWLLLRDANGRVTRYRRE